MMKKQLKEIIFLLAHEHVFFFLCIVTPFIVPNEGSPLIPANSPYNTILSQLVLGVALNRLIMLFINKEYVPYISIILLISCIIFLPLRIFGSMQLLTYLLTHQWVILSFTISNYIYILSFFFWLFFFINLIW